ncbi:MAG TPA: phosphatidate cytidylyltransferase [Longimicrobiales bacterium]|nr:phosphatidate cytidylyltransferase [Longimicrobiales bacterium]
MKRPSDLAARLGVAAVGIPVVLGVLWLGGWALAGLIGFLAVLGAGEFYALVRNRGDVPFGVLGAGVAGILVLTAGADPELARFAPRAVWLLLGLSGLTLALSLRFRWPGGSPLGAFSSTLAGVLYVGVPLSFVPLLRALGSTPLADVAGGPGATFFVPMAFVLLPLLTTWAGDTAAYFVGHAVGRRKLAPAVSPGKTIEGSLGGVAGSVGAATLVAYLWLAELPVRAVPVGTAALVGLALAVATQLGDLVESALKREAGVKDSGSLLPGHGGVLDRLDALLFAFPLTWFLLSLIWRGA